MQQCHLPEGDLLALRLTWHVGTTRPSTLQKGIHLIEHAVHRTIELGGQFVVLGTGHADSGLRNLAGGHFR